MMRRVWRHIGWSRVAGLLVLAILLLIRIIDPIFVERLRLQAFDVYQRLHPRTPAVLPVAILDVDDRSLTEVGQWPWPRTEIAAMTEKAMQAGAVALAFDIIFSEPDRLSPERIAEDNPDLPAQIRTDLSELPSNDAQLAEAFARSRVVVGQTSVRNAGAGGGNATQPLDVPHAVIGPDPRPFMLRFPHLLQNLDELENAATGHGVFTVIPDPDGVYRRVPIVMYVQDKYRLGLSIELLRVATGGEAFAIRSNAAGIDGVVVARQLIQTQQDGTVWNNFSPSDPGRFVSATDLLNDRVPPDRLAGHLVLVGTSAIGLEDFRPTPLGVPMAGVEIHAQVLENILNKSLLTRPNYAIGMELVWIAAMSLLVIALAPILPARLLIVATLALVSGYLLFTYYLFVRNGQLIDPTMPVIATVVSAMLMSSVNYIREEVQRRQIRSAFGQYVSPDLVAELADNPDRLKLGGERRELTLLFTDVRGFTTISEAFADDPAGLTQLMNRFLTVMSDAVMDHGGTIDKYMGDAVMAFWNAPVDEADHARLACTAALDMLARIERLNAELLQKGGGADVKVPEIDIGIGLNTGQCVVGNMGSDKRFDYSALGDAVNLASRLEGQTKAYAVSIIIGSQTESLVRHDFALLELDLIRVKGKTVPEQIYALLGPKALTGSAAFEKLTQANGQMHAQYRSSNWDSAIHALTELREAAKELGVDLEGYCQVYSDRIQTYRDVPPEPGWGGVHEAAEK